MTDQNPNPSPEIENPASANGSADAGAEPPQIDIPELEGAPADGGEGVAPAEPPALSDGLEAPHDGFIGKAAFFPIFCGSFRAINFALYFRNRIKLETLDTVGDRPMARPASDVAYEIILETPDLHFLIRPGRWTQRLMILGAFAFDVGNAATEEYREHYAAEIETESSDPEETPHAEGSGPEAGASGEGEAAGTFSAPYEYGL